MPSYVENSEELNFNSEMARKLSPPAPLVPASQLRALIADLMAVSVPGDPDIPKIITALAQGHLPTRLPRRPRRGFTRRIHLLVDTADSMWLFQHDASLLVEAFDAFGSSLIQDEHQVQGAPALEPLPTAAPGDTILVLSSLGMDNESPATAKRQLDWINFAAFQRRRGLRLVGLVPFHPKRWPPALKRNFRLVQWTRPGLVTQPTQDLTYLAQVLSLAAVIDPALLRYARTRVLPTSDAGAEVDFVNGPWVASHNPRIIVLRPDWTVPLRTKLAEDPASVEVARRILAAHRPQEVSWARVVAEEALVYLALHSDQDSRENLERAFGRVICSLFGRMKDPASARWAIYLVESLPEAIQAMKPAQLLKAVASEILNTSHEFVADVFKDQNIKWSFTGQTFVGVRWTGDNIIVREPPRIGDKIIQVPDTRPYAVVIVSMPNTHRTKVLRISPGKNGWTRATGLPRYIKTKDGAEYQLDELKEQDEQEENLIWDRLDQAYKTDQMLIGKITGIFENSYYCVDIGVDATIKVQDIGREFKNPTSLVGTVRKVRIIDLNRANKRVGVTFRPRDDIWQMLEEKYKSAETVSGEIKELFANGYGCIVDVGILANIATSELQESERTDLPSLVGKKLEFLIIKMSSIDQSKIRLSRLFDEVRLFNKYKTISTDGKTTILGTVTKAVAGGFLVDIGISAFLPNEEIGTAISDIETLVGQKRSFAIKSVAQSKNQITLSIALLEKVLHRKTFFNEQKVGELCRGIVKKITDFGAFIDLDGIDGLLHATDMSWSRLNHPSEILKVGQEIEVLVLDIDREKERVSLGLKQKTDNPWDKIGEKYPVNLKVKGKVTNLVPYGVFVELEPGIEGLVHVSELSWTKRVVRPTDVLTLGQELEAIVLGVSNEDQKVSLSVRQLDTNPWEVITDKYRTGTRFKGKVRNLAAYGAFVELEEGIDGMIHVSDLSWMRKINHPSEMLKKGDEIEAEVMEIDKVNHRISLSLKHLSEDPWKSIDSRYKIGDLVSGKVSKVASFGAFVQLDVEFIGFVHISEISNDPVGKVKEVLKVGQEVTARVIKVDKTERRIGLSIKAAD